VLLNFARDAIVDPAAVLRSLDAGRLGKYVCDFPEPALLGHPKIIAMPHIGASTEESEENCAVMAANQLVDYLENGNIVNSVNFPKISMERSPGTSRITFSNDNVSGVLGHVLSILARPPGQRRRHDEQEPRRTGFQHRGCREKARRRGDHAIKAVERVIRVRVI
jgi:D-3-phosphoglycerate dehydrogenase